MFNLNRRRISSFLFLLLDLNERRDLFCIGDSCKNNGTCSDSITSFTCSCADGFTGEECETDVDDCIDIRCQNNGTCKDEVNYFSCDCGDGFTGSLCESNIDECESNPCQNGGTC